MERSHPMSAAGSLTGIVFNIQRFTVHDGPGIRTEVFLKGCPLRCLWCSNPESQKVHPQVGVYPDRCIGVDKCGFCISACPVEAGGAFIVEDNRVTGINRDVCTDCLRCAEECPAMKTLEIYGKEMTVEEVMEVVLADRDFYEKSGGGVTLSGGEVFVQPEFSLALLEACKRRGLHTCVESSLHCKPDLLDRLYPFVDLVITDIKHMDPSEHKRLTGVGNERILENIRKTARGGMPLVVRIPIVADHNNSEENIAATARFIAKELDNKVKQVQLIPYRELGLEKYQSLGMDYPMGDFQAPAREAWEKNIRALVEQMKSYGVPAVAGTSNKLEP